MQRALCQLEANNRAVDLVITSRQQSQAQSSKGMVTWHDAPCRSALSTNQQMGHRPQPTKRGGISALVHAYTLQHQAGAGKFSAQPTA